MFNIGAGEAIVILIAALLILGPKRLPELARGMGKFLREFRRQTDDVRTMVESEFYRMDEEFQKPAQPPASGTETGAAPALAHDEQGRAMLPEASASAQPPLEGAPVPAEARPPAAAESVASPAPSVPLPKA